MFKLLKCLNSDILLFYEKHWLTLNFMAIVHLRKHFLKQHLLRIAFREGLLVYQCLPEDTDKCILRLLKQNGFIVEETGN